MGDMRSKRMWTAYLLIPFAGFFLADLAGVNSNHVFLCRMYAEVYSTTCQQPVEDVTFTSGGQQLSSTNLGFSPGIFTYLLPCPQANILNPPPVSVSSPGFVSKSRQVSYGVRDEVKLDCANNSCYPFETELTITSDCDGALDDLSVACEPPDCMVDSQDSNTFRLGYCRRPTFAIVTDRGQIIEEPIIYEDVQNIRLPCSATNINRVDGRWGQWGQTTPCTVTCGDDGTIARRRYCNSPPPQNGGQPCLGPDEDNFDCSYSQSCPVDGHWSTWIQWTNCQVTCSEVAVFQTRVRACGSPVPSSGGQPCVGQNMESRQCENVPSCKKESVDGGWSEWSTWGNCGKRKKRQASNASVRRKRAPTPPTSKRSRTCTEPEPMNNGADCVGDDFEERSEGSCPLLA